MIQKSKKVVCSNSDIRLKLEIDERLFLPKIPLFMAKTIIPVDLNELIRLENLGSESGPTIRHLMSFVYKQVKPML